MWAPKRSCGDCCYERMRDSRSREHLQSFWCTSGNLLSSPRLPTRHRLVVAVARQKNTTKTSGTTTRHSWRSDGASPADAEQVTQDTHEEARKQGNHETTVADSLMEVWDPTISSHNHLRNVDLLEAKARMCFRTTCGK